MTLVHQGEPSGVQHPDGKKLGAPSPKSRRSYDESWSQLPKRSEMSGNLFPVTLGNVNRCGELFEFRKVVFIGACSGSSPWLRLGIFAGLHGDEPSGVQAVFSLIRELSEVPDLAYGLELHFYPICNPSGYVDKTRWLRGGPDMNREFWRQSSEMEVRLIEKELSILQFDGLISLHSDDTSDGIYGYVGGDVLTKHLLEPALEAASVHLPQNSSSIIDGWKAQKAIIEDSFEGVLSAPEKQYPKPFEIVFETPAAADEELQSLAHRACLLSIFQTLPALRSHAADI